MITYIKIHLFCFLVSIVLRFLMSLLLVFNKHNRLLIEFYKKVSESFSGCNVIFSVSQKRFYSRKHEYSLKIPRLPYQSFWTCFFEIRAFRQGLFLGPIQVLLEGIALVAGLFQFLVSQREFNKFEELQARKEFEERLLPLKKIEGEEDTLLFLFKLIIEDINRGNLPQDVLSSTIDGVERFLEKHFSSL